MSCSNLSDDCDINSRCPSSGGSPNAGASGGGGKGNAGSSPGGGNANAGDGGTTSSGAGSSGTSGVSGDAGAGGTDGSCDTGKSPASEGCLVSDSYAIFVSPEGSDDNAGTQQAPLATLTKAVEVAGGDKLVMVCSASYDEHVSITAGARIYGGFKCADWSSDTGRPVFKPATAGPALKVDAVTEEVLIDGLSFEVGDAVAAGETALASLVNGSPKVTLRSVSLTAGKGKAGANGTLADFVFPNASTLNGNPEGPAGTGGGEKICACQAGLMSVGGLGGNPSSSGQDGADGLPALGGGTAGDRTKTCSSGGGGGDGFDAPAAGPATGAIVLGTASASGWLAAFGADGATGQPGQGGGGGASRNSLGHGGGGGCGGCGGNGGTAGKGGGGSVALLAIGSPVLLEACILTTTDAGNGGNGAAGQFALNDIGAGGGVVSSINSCPGGNGGKGAAGGASGGGAGGISVGVLWKGAMAPTVSVDTTIANGKAGAKGLGGAVGTNDGIAGIAQKVLPQN